MPSVVYVLDDQYRFIFELFRLNLILEYQFTRRLQAWVRLALYEFILMFDFDASYKIRVEYKRSFENAYGNHI